ncbi:uncharacterized protein LOC117902969 [Drosophila subobscura]|uniref:uncharacterized protein LOC117902969 n=1 Tax=Drosophila subobscura TaxID=7241 RepID=UPI00155A1521|nr:uncharacterized protein LOC117902969 [Drosophila subobscura]
MLPITYHFLNTLAKDKTQQMPIVITSKTTSLNPISGPHNYTHFLHPSDDAMPPQNTNTYISENFLTKVVKDELKKLNTVTSKDILTQVAITEPMTTSIPIVPTFSKIKIKSNNKKTGMFLNEDLNTDFSTELICQEEQSAVHIFATKTFFTTLTFYTTFLNNSISGISFHDPIPKPMTVYENKNRTDLIEQHEYTNAKYDYKTQVIENIITNTVASSLLRPELVSMFSTELMRKKGKNDRNVIVTMATLLDGQTMQVTAMKTVTKLDTSQKYVLEDIQPTVNLHTNHGQKTKAISTEKSYTINKISVKSTESIQTSPQTDEDLSLSESENLDVYPEPYIETNPLGQTALVKLPVSSTVSQIIGPLTLEQFRPMLNVMADLIKKNIANRHGSEHMRQTYKEGNLKNSVATTNVNHMSIRTVERPVYIPLQETGKYDFLSWHSYDGINNKNGSVDINAVSKSNIKSIRKHNSNHQAVKNVSFPRQAENSKKTYGSSLLRTGIPISPGEVITANADVIIGRPSMNVSLKDTAIRHNLLEMRNNLSVPKFYRQLIRSKTIYPSVPLIHPPKPNQDQLKMNRETLNDYGSILKPPPPINNQPASTFSKNVLQYPILLLAPSGLTQSRIKYPLSIPFEKNKNPSDNYYASQQIASLNSELNSNEILEIMRIPEIFSTRLPAITKYLAISNTHDYSQIPHSLIYPLNLAGTPRTPLSASTYSGHHQVNLRKEMLSHTVNILAPPLTFKKESELFAHATAIKGHITHSSMPLIKIPVNEAKVDVRVSPQINGIVLVQDKHASADSSANKFKQRNQNLSNFAIGQPTTKAASESKASENVLANTNTPSTTKKNEISIKYKSLLGFKDKLYYNHSKAAEGFRHGDIGFSSEQDQKADYSNYSLQSYKPFYENNPENTSNMWLLMHHRKPFISSPHSPTVIERRDSNMITSGTDKIFLATGDNFHLGSLPKSEFYFELEKSKRTPQIQISINPFSIAKQKITVFVDAKKTVLEYSSQRANVYTTSTPENTTEKFPATLPPKHANSLESFSPLVSAGVQHFNTQQLSSNLEEVHLQNNRSEYNSSEQLKQDTKRLEPSEIVYDPFQTILKRTTELTNGLDSDSMKKSFLKPTHLIFIAPDNVPLLKPTTTTKSHTQEFLGVGVPFLSNTTSLDSSKFLKTSLIPTRKNTISVYKRSSTYSITSKKVLGKLSQLTDSKKHFQSRHPDQGIQIRSLVPDNTHIINATKTSHLFLFIGTKSESSLGILPTRKTSKEPQTILGMSKKKKIGVQSDIFAQISQSASSLPQLKTTFSNPVKKKPSQILNGFRPETINISTIIKTRPDLYQRTTTKDSINSLTLLETSKSTSVIEQNHLNSSLLLTHPVRDEERYSSIDSGTHISGILIDTPSKTKQIKQLGSASSCNPFCKLKKNEICVIMSDGDTSVSHCACRPSFGRMFPDRPCKPTYTYEMQMETMRVGNYILKFNDGLKTNASNEYRHLSGIILDAVDRMIMQSDFRDVYHGVQLISITASKQENILSTFLLQLSDNSDQMRLLTVFKKYLRQSNFSIGGTELYTSKEGIKSLQFKDFDECRHENFHDCSINASCFNLAGSYTCSCLNGYIDISDNAIYPGRRCSNNIIGCEKCNYHGKCITTSLDKVSKITTVCQCLPWYAGTRCQLNLKILLICLIAIGAVLFILLLFCILIIHAKRKRECASANSTFMTASNIYPSVLKSSGKSRLVEYILDSHSESSYNSGSVLYKKGQGVKKSKMKPKAIQKENSAYKYKVTSTRNMYDVLDLSDPIEEPDFPSLNMEKGVAEADTDQDRSLTFMIPRAKFHQPYILKHSQLNNNLSMENKEAQRDLHKKGELEYRSVFIDTSKQLIKTVECSAQECITHTSALVSAGYEVSAIVNDPNVVSAMNVEIESHKNVKVDSESNGARSFDETTVAAVTAPVHFKLGMQIESHKNEEVNTMAERDLGSTFLLPHTHLYKPVKIPSEFSGFDSV